MSAKTVWFAIAVVLCTLLGLLAALALARTDLPFALKVLLVVATTAFPGCALLLGVALRARKASRPGKK